VVIKTANGYDLIAEKVIVCAGPWASRLLPELNLPLSPVVLPVTYWKQLIPGAYSSKKGFPVIFNSRHTNVYGIPELEYPGLVKILHHGGPAIDPDQRDKPDLSSIISHTQNYVRDHLPDLDSTAPALVEKCIYTCTPDHLPIMDVHPKTSRIIFGVGYSGSGFKHSPASGKILSELAQGNHEMIKTLFPDVDKFLLSRFNQKLQFVSANKEGSPVIAKL
jgi:glycine/D-amino acid oxidase-like deaminating enzyme